MENLQNVIAKGDVKRLSEIIVETLKEAFEHGGSSIEDFKDIHGNKGNYQNYHKIYGRMICSKCGGSVSVIKQATRTTYLCLNCQKEL